MAKELDLFPLRFMWVVYDCTQGGTVSQAIFVTDESHEHSNQTVRSYKLCVSVSPLAECATTAYMMIELCLTHIQVREAHHTDLPKRGGASAGALGRWYGSRRRR